MKEEVEREKAGGNPSRKTKTGLRNSMGKRMIKSHHPRPTWDQWDLAPLSSSSMRALSFTSPPLLATPSTSYPAHCHHTYACRGVCVGLCACACAHNTHMHIHILTYPLQTLWSKPLVFLRGTSVFLLLSLLPSFWFLGPAKSQQFIAYTPSWEQRIFGSTSEDSQSLYCPGIFYPTVDCLFFSLLNMEFLT